MQAGAEHRDRRGCLSRCSALAAATGCFGSPRPMRRTCAALASRHAKSNGIDADTLARLPLLAPGSLQPLELPGVEAAALDRRVRACDRLSRQGALHKRRIKDLVCAS